MNTLVVPLLLAVLHAHKLVSLPIVVASQDPPGPADVVLLQQISHILHVLVSSTVIELKLVQDAPLVQKDWHVVLLLKGDWELLEDILVPVLVEPHRVVSFLRIAVSISPASSQLFALVSAWILVHFIFASEVEFWHEVVKGVDDVVHAFQLHLVRQGKHIVVPLRPNHARSHAIN